MAIILNDFTNGEAKGRDESKRVKLLPVFNFEFGFLDPLESTKGLGAGVTFDLTFFDNSKVATFD